jgi:hypothetical protein
MMGPNCMGMISNEVDLYAVDFVKLQLPKGTPSFLSQSGRPTINVPDSAIRGSVFDYGNKYRPIVLSSYRAAAQALDRMEWYAAHRRDHRQ